MSTICLCGSNFQTVPLPKSRKLPLIVGFNDKEPGDFLKKIPMKDEKEKDSQTGIQNFHIEIV
jgi:hypothetical protein